jgi:hypothetical protein
MFQPDYLQALIELGEADVESQMDRISAFLDRQSAARGGGAPPESNGGLSRV